MRYKIKLESFYLFNNGNGLNILPYFELSAISKCTGLYNPYKWAYISLFVYCLGGKNRIVIFLVSNFCWQIYCYFRA